MKKLTPVFLLMMGIIWGAVLLAAPPNVPNNIPPGGSGSMQPSYFPNGVTVVGSHEVNALGSPSAPTLTTNGVAGTTSLNYACIAEDQNASATTGEGESVPGAAATITTANGTLSTPNSVNVLCSGDKHAVSFLVTKGGTANQIGRCYAASGSCTLVDTGQATPAYVANTIDQTGKVAAGISGIVGDVRDIRIAGTATLIKGITGTVTMCTTSGVNGVCTEPTAVLSNGYADANYTASCSCTSVGTNLPEIYSVTKASNAIQVSIVSAGATPSASCSVIDCILIHD